MSKNWQTYTYEIASNWRDIPTTAGCYVIYCDGQIIYIGQAQNVAKRLKSYNIRFGYGRDILTSFGWCETLTVKVRPTRRYGDWAMVELRLINRLQPKFNCAGTARKRGTPIDEYAKAAAK